VCKPGAQHLFRHRNPLSTLDSGKSLIHKQHLADRDTVEAEELQKQAAAGETPASDSLMSPSTGPSVDQASAATAQPTLDNRADNCAASLPNRRRGDRRAEPTTFWKSLRSPRRRAGGRRSGEGLNTYVDRYRKSDVLLLAAVFALNVADALFTLVWVERGGSEANPVMDWFLQQGEWVFLGQKCIVVGLWLVILVVHKNFQIARAGLWFLLVLYGSILLYHIYLQTAGVPVAPVAPIAMAPGQSIPTSLGI